MERIACCGGDTRLHRFDGIIHKNFAFVSEGAERRLHCSLLWKRSKSVVFDLGGDVGITKIGPVLASMRVLDDMQNFLKGIVRSITC